MSIALVISCIPLGIFICTYFKNKEIRELEEEKYQLYRKLHSMEGRSTKTE